MTHTLTHLLAATVEVDLESKLKASDSTVKFFDLSAIISNVSNIIIYIGGIAAFAWLLIGGLNWVLAGGDKGKIENARNQITQAIVGLAVLAFSYAIFYAVQYVLGLKIVQ